MSMVRGELN